MKALGAETNLADEDFHHAACMVQEEDQRLEQAQLEQVIALSLQAEEERLRLVETGEVAAEVAAQVAPLIVRPSVLTPAPMAAPVAPGPVPSPEAVEASRYE